MKWKHYTAIGTVVLAVSTALPALAGLEYSGEVYKLEDIPGYDAAAMRERVIESLTFGLKREPTEAEITARMARTFPYWEEVTIKNGAGWPWSHCQTVVTTQGLTRIEQPKSAQSCVAETYIVTGENLFTGLEAGDVAYVPARLSNEPQKQLETLAAFDPQAAVQTVEQMKTERLQQPATVGGVLATLDQYKQAKIDPEREAAITKALEGVVTVNDYEAEMTAIDKRFGVIENNILALQTATAGLRDEHGNRLFATTDEVEAINGVLYDENGNRLFATTTEFDGVLQKTQTNEEAVAALVDGKVLLKQDDGSFVVATGETAWWQQRWFALALAGAVILAFAGVSWNRIGFWMLRRQNRELTDRVDVVEETLMLVVGLTAAGNLEGDIPSQAKLDTMLPDETIVLGVYCGDGVARQLRITKVVKNGKHYVQLPDIRDQGDELVRSHAGLLAARIAKAIESNNVVGAEVQVAPAGQTQLVDPFAEEGEEPIPVPAFLRRVAN